MKFLEKKLENWKIAWNQKKDIPSYYPFVMTDNEKELLKKYLTKSNRYLEFGLGGSTIFALIHTQIPVISIDTNIPWIDFMKKYKIVSQNLGNRLEIFHFDIGPTKSWGFPVDETHKEKFPDFSSKIFELISADDFDMILIDGRFRVACALQVILKRYHNPQNLRILIHDYSFREEYKLVEKYLEVIENQDSLFVFKIRSDIEIDEVQKEYDRFKYIAD